MIFKVGMVAVVVVMLGGHGGFVQLFHNVACTKSHIITASPWKRPRTVI